MSVFVTQEQRVLRKIEIFIIQKNMVRRLRIITMSINDFLIYGLLLYAHHSLPLHSIYGSPCYTGCIKKSRQFRNGSQPREAALTMKFFVNIDCLGTCDVE